MDFSAIPSHMIPTWRTDSAIKRGVERNILLRTWGGIGDQICAEPTLRYALKTFKGCNISLASELPELFQHLEFKKVYNLKECQPLWENYFTFDTIRNTDDLLWEFMSHMLVNCVDYPSLCAFRCMLPTADKEVKLEPSQADFDRVTALLYRGSPLDYVAVHPGRHWQSKTFPKHWWNEVLEAIQEKGQVPILIGGDTDDNRGTVDVNPESCIDLRNRLTIQQTIALFSLVPVLLTNDSAPLHMAVDSNCWIGFVATVKHPDHIMHWRNGQWGWRMKNHGLGGIWDVLDYCPNKPNKVEAENVGDELLASWLPDPKEFAAWGCARSGA